MRGSMTQLNKIPQKFQADVLAFFGMELGGENVAAPNGGRECFTILGSRRDNRLIYGPGEKAMDEINVAAGWNPSIKRTIRLRDIDLVPADLRNFQAGHFFETHDFAFIKTKTSRAAIELFTALEEGLVSDANTQERLPSLNETLYALKQFLPAHGCDAVVKRPDTRKDRATRIFQCFGIARELHIGAHLAQRLLDTANVARAIIEKRYHAAKKLREDLVSVE